jgi:hypothetical protein
MDDIEEKKVDIKKILMYAGAAIVFIGIALLSYFLIRDFMMFTRYTNDKEGISIKYPKGWKMVEHPLGGEAIVGFVKPKESALIVFQSNWNISKTELKVPLTLEAYVKAADAQILFAFSDAVPSSKPVMLSGHPGYELIYVSSKDGGLVLISYVFIYRGTAYNITYADEKEAYFDPKRKQLIADVIRSLKVNF